MVILTRTSSLPFQEFFLPLQSPAISAHALIFANHAMAGNHQRHMIRGTGARDRSHAFRFADRSGNPVEETCRPKRDALYFSPHPPLKRSRLDVEWQIDAGTLTVEVLEHPA